MSIEATAPPPVPVPGNEVGHLIRKQREAMQLTVAQLAGRIGVSRNTITNYEAGKTEPGASDLLRLSGALGCSINDLLSGEGTTTPPRFAFRVHAPLRNHPEIAATASKYLRAYNEIEEITHSRLQGKLRTFDGDNQGPLTDREIESAADSLRQSNGLHDRDPGNITRVLEGLGVRTLFFDRGPKGIESFSTIQGEMILVMLRNRKRLIERTIFSAAHELGHLVLHPHLFSNNELEEEMDPKRYEDEANQFAGNFLVPSDDLVRIWNEERLTRLSLFNALILLKRVFHVSFHCLYHRVTQLKLPARIDEATFMNQFKQQLGIVGPVRLENYEPDPLQPEVLSRTTRFSRLVRSAFLQNLIGVSKVAEMFQVPVERAMEITMDWLRPKHELVEDGDL